MKVLFIGGTGNLSLDCTRRALARGMEVWHLNRGSHPGKAPEGVHSLQADVRDEEAVDRVLGRESFDAVVDFIAYLPGQVEADVRLFRDRAGQYVFISSASAYRKPAVHPVITESTPLSNPFWQYSRDKIACEDLIRAQAGDLPWTIIRPSHTYANGWVPTAFSSSDFTVAGRILEGKEIIVHGDGQALWTLTHARDFAVGLVGLLGNPAAYGEAVQITGEEALTWESIHQTVASALGREARIVHIPSDFIARAEPSLAGGFLGDKAWTSLFDCSKLRRLVPDFRTTISFQEGIRQSLDWLRAEPSRQKVDPAVGERIERILAAWRKAMDQVWPSGQT